MDKTNLTIDTKWLEGARVNVPSGTPVWPSKPNLAQAAGRGIAHSSQRDTNPLLISSLLVRAKLSKETVIREEERLRKQEVKARSLRHWGESRVKNKWKHYKKKGSKKAKYWVKLNRDKKRRRACFEKEAGWGALLRARGYKKFEKDDWDRLIAPLFEEYSPEYLSIKLYYRVPAAIAGKGSRERYGRQGWPYSVYTLNVEHKLLGVVYDGYEQALLEGKVQVEAVETKPAKALYSNKKSPT